MKSRHHLLFFLFLILAFTLVFISEDIRNLIMSNTKIDSIGHIIGFFCLAWILSSFVKLPLLNTAICLVFYAVLSEIGQYYLGFRNGEFRDFIADIIGILLFVILKWCALVYGRKQPTSSMAGFK